MIAKIKELFMKLHKDTQCALQFCLECENLCYYSDFDTCNCGKRYAPADTNEVCPNCGKGDDEDYISHCSVCDAEIDISYLSYFIENPEKLTETQLLKIHQQLERMALIATTS